MADPTTDRTDRTAAITARYDDWYESRDDWQEDGLTADWSHRDAPETLSHAIVREDIPWLLEQLAAANTERGLLQQRTDELTATISEARAADCRAIEYGDTDRQRLENVFGLLETADPGKPTAAL